MGAISILTPIVIASWPVPSSAILGAVTSMGFALHAEAKQEKPRKRKVETDVPNSEVVADQMGRGEKLVVQRDDVTVEIGRDERGACTVCVTGDKHSDRELRKIGEDVAGRIVQQYAYHKLMTELKKRNYTVVDEQVLADESVHLRIRL